MDYKDTLAWLKSYRNLYDKFTYLNNRIQSIKSITYDDNGGAGLPRSITDLIDEKTKVVEHMEEIEDAIDGIENQTYSTVLAYRFLMFYSLDKTGETMSYSLQQIYRLQQKAVESLFMIINDKEC